MKTLADIIPQPKSGEWYFVYSSMESKNKIVVVIDEMQNRAVSDTGFTAGIAYYFKPQKISKEEAKYFLKELIPTLEKDENKKEIDEILIKGMKAFYKTYFPED